jgi:hypothetical protein
VSVWLGRFGFQIEYAVAWELAKHLAYFFSGGAGECPYQDGVLPRVFVDLTDDEKDVYILIDGAWCEIAYMDAEKLLAELTKCVGPQEASTSTRQQWEGDSNED